MTYYVACREHVITAPSLEQAVARADVLNANARSVLSLCQNLHIGVEASTQAEAKERAAQRETREQEVEFSIGTPSEMGWVR